MARRRIHPAPPSLRCPLCGGQARDLFYHSTYGEQRQAQVIPSKLIDAALSRPAQTSKRQTYHPPMSHPWKYFDYSEKSMEAMEKRGDICILRK